MPKARHRKRIRTARVNPAGQPLGAAVANGGAAAEDGASNVGAVHACPAAKKVGKKESEVTGLLDKLKSVNLDERVWASVSSLSSPLPSQVLTPLFSGRTVVVDIDARARDAQAAPLQQPDRDPHLVPHRPISLRLHRIPRSPAQPRRLIPPLRRLRDSQQARPPPPRQLAYPCPRCPPRRTTRTPRSQARRSPP